MSGEKEQQMNYQDMNKEQLINEISALKQKNKELEHAESEFRQTEKKLVSSEEKFRTLAESSSFAIMMHQGDNWIYANRAAVEISGYTEEELCGMHFWSFVHPDHRDMVKQSGQNRQQGKALPRAYEFKIIAKDGTVKWVSLSGSPIKYEDKPTALISVVDITEKKLVDEVLRESEERYRTILEEMEDIYIESDLKGFFTFANPASSRMLGFSTDELIGRHFTKHTTVADAERIMIYYKEIFETGITGKPFSWNIVNIKGETRAFETVVSLMKDKKGTPLGFRALGRDITERKRMNVTLKESERKYRTIYEDAVFGIYQTTPEGRFISANTSFVRMAGYGSPQELIDNIKKIETQLYVHSEDRQRFIEIIAEKGIVKGFEVEFYKKDRSIFWVQLNTREVKDQQGRIICYEGIAADITSRKQAEAEKMVMEERLNRAEKMEALGTLAGGVAHDLNNVLGVIVGYSELLLNEVDKASKIRPRLMKIMSGSEKAAAIVRDLLTLARRGVPGRKIINLNKIIADCQQSPEFANLSVNHPSVKIKTDLAPQLLNISGSSVHLEKTLYNLISNASESMAKGGIVTIKTINQYLDKPIHGYDQIHEGDYVILTVTDTGEGIPSVDLQRIFEPFYTKKVMGRSGTGLGLAVVWGTVKDHQGYINVQSQEGKGSTFTLYFPVTREEISIGADSLSIAEYMGKGETILVVDDVKDQRDLATEMFKKLNYNVVSVASGEAAIAYIKECKIDLMVLDMIMDPGMDGLDTYVGVLEIQPKQKAIVVSGFSESDRVHAAQALGAGQYVEKPYVIEKLGLAVRNELDRVR